MRDATRDRLIEAASDLFAERGYERTGIEDIARRAGLTTGATYSNFRGKRELLAAAIAPPDQAAWDGLMERLLGSVAGGVNGRPAAAAGTAG